METETPSLTSAAACLRLAGVIRLTAPIWSSLPHRPQFESWVIIWSTVAAVTVWLDCASAVRVSRPKVISARTAAPVNNAKICLFDTRMDSFPEERILSQRPSKLSPSGSMLSRQLLYPHAPDISGEGPQTKQYLIVSNVQVRAAEGEGCRCQAGAVQMVDGERRAVRLGRGIQTLRPHAVESVPCGDIV